MSEPRILHRRETDDGVDEWYWADEPTPRSCFATREEAHQHALKRLQEAQLAAALREARDVFMALAEELSTWEGDGAVDQMRVAEAAAEAASAALKGL